MSATIIPFPRAKREPMTYSPEFNALLQETAIKLGARLEWLETPKPREKWQEMEAALLAKIAKRLQERKDSN